MPCSPKCPAGYLLKKRVAAFLVTDRREHPVSWNDDGVVGERGQLFERRHQRRHVAAGEVGTPDRAGEQGVAGEEHLLVLEVLANACAGVTRGLKDFQAF